MSKAKIGHRAGEFATQHRAVLLAQAKNICRDDTDAEDLVQETLLRFIQSFDTVDALPSQRSCEAWLANTLTHLFIDQCRRRRVQANSSRDPNLGREAMVASEPAAHPVYDTITDEQFAQALDTLSPKARVTFQLHVEGRRYQDIARSLGIQVGTVGKRLHDARAKLRAFLQQYLSTGMN